MDTIMTDEHVPCKALIEMLLSSISSATNLTSLEESKPLRALVKDFLLANHDSLPSSKVEAEFSA